MSITQNNLPINSYLIKCVRETGPSETPGGKEKILDKIWVYCILARNKKDALKKFLLQDTSLSALSMEISHKEYYLDDEVPPKCIELQRELAESDVLNLENAENEQDYKIYLNFVEDNLKLIIDVLLILNEKSVMFEIEEIYIQI